MTAPSRSGLYFIYLIFAVILAGNFFFWKNARQIDEPWSNVPPATGAPILSMMALGDDQIAYRMTGYFLQNLGSAGGRFVALQDYNFPLLEKWLFASHELDPYSDYIPYLAAYYFSATQNAEQVRYLIPYLTENGSLDYPRGKWRWAAQAVYLAQFSLEDYALALNLANNLAARPNVADWARQLPALVNLRMGNKEAAYELLLNMLDKERENLNPAEINAIADIICTRILSAPEASDNPLCHGLK
jgi:hypothetical protein